ncbi:hypothetical protein FOZ62_003095, partial [Perkinsus olseni]
SQLLVVEDAAARSTHEALLTLALHASATSRSLLRRTFFVYVTRTVDDMLDLRLGSGLADFLSPRVLDLLTDMCSAYRSRGAGDELTEVLIFKLLQWSVREKRDGLLENMLHSKALMKFLLKACSPSVTDAAAVPLSNKSLRLVVEMLRMVPAMSSKKLIGHHGLLAIALNAIDVWPPCVTTTLVHVLGEGVLGVGSALPEHSPRSLDESPSLGRLLVKLIARNPHRIHSRLACRALATVTRIPHNQDTMLSEASTYVSKQSSTSSHEGGSTGSNTKPIPLLWDLYHRLLVVMKQYKLEVERRASGPEHWDTAHHHRELTLLLVLMCNLLNQDKLGDRILNRLVIGLSPFAAEDTSSELVGLLLDCWHRLPVLAIPPKRGGSDDEGVESDTMRNARFMAFTASRALHVLCNVLRYKPIWVAMLLDAAVASSVASGLHRILTSPTSASSFWTVEDLRMG